jgi:hypothetical protein
MFDKHSVDPYGQRNIRLRIRAMLASGELKPYYGMIQSPSIETTQICAACALPIALADAAPFGHQYADGSQWFHVWCSGLWEEERKARLREDLRDPSLRGRAESRS